MSGDVFRKPACPMLFSAFVGAGVQFLLLIFVIIFFNMFSLYTPLSISYWSSMLYGMFPFMGAANGYVSARMYKFYNGTNWITLTMITCCAVSGFFVVCLCMIYIFEYLETERIVISEILIIMLMWLMVNLPLTAIGTYGGFRSPKFEVENKPTRLARKRQKDTTCLLNPLLCYIVGSVIPFSVIGLQFYYIFTSISGDQNITVLYWSLYYGFIISLVLVAEVSIIQTYLGLCWGQPNWWWRSFIYGGGTGMLFFLAMLYRLMFRTTIYEVTTLCVYLVIMLMITAVLTFSFGTVAVASTFAFNTVIFKKAR